VTGIPDLKVKTVGVGATLSIAGTLPMPEIAMKGSEMDENPGDRKKDQLILLQFRGSGKQKAESRRQKAVGRWSQYHLRKQMG